MVVPKTVVVVDVPGSIPADWPIDPGRQGLVAGKAVSARPRSGAVPGNRPAIPGRSNGVGTPCLYVRGRHGGVVAARAAIGSGDVAIRSGDDAIVAGKSSGADDAVASAVLVLLPYVSQPLGGGMTDEREYDSSEWVEETGASTGDARENEPADAGYTDEQDRVFRSHFQHVNRLADRGYEQVRPAYHYGAEIAVSRTDRRPFEEIEKDLENGWLSVRVGGGDWASVREFVRAGYDRSQAATQGRVSDMPAIGTTGSHDRQSYSDPLASNMDPTDPSSPEEGAEP